MKPPQPIIVDRGEFIDVLDRLRHGHLLVQCGNGADTCVLDGAVIYYAHPTLLAYGLLDRVQLPDLAPHTRCYRLSARGQPFAERVCREWRLQPLWHRLAVRVTG